MDGLNVAVFLDFENLAISAETVYSGQNRPLGIEPIIRLAESKGEMRIRKAYADWSKDLFAQYQPSLMDKGFEMIHLPATNTQGKNGSDVRLAIDVMEMLEQYPYIDTIVIGSGDTDFIPLIQRLRSRGKTVIVLGFEHSVGNLVKRNSAEFISLETLLGKAEPAQGPAWEEERKQGRALLQQYIQTRDEIGPVLMAKLKQQLLRIDPAFSEKKLGFSSFKSFIESMVGDLVIEVLTEQETLPMVVLREKEGDMITSSIQVKANALRFLSKKLRYLSEPERRMLMAEALFVLFQERRQMSMTEMFDAVYDYLDQSLPKTDIKKYVNTLFTGGTFETADNREELPLLARPFTLGATYNSPESIDFVYIRRVSEILQSRYQELPSGEILELLM
ncbi:MAG: NYN domain-containing protein [Bacteroidota bacterium]